jgi:hypothetical protein
MSTTIEYSKPQGTYFSVLADGKFHTTVSEGTVGAVKRDYETSDGKKGSKWELVAQSIAGKITNIAIYESDFGKNIQVYLGDEVIVSLQANSNFGEDFMKKLPNIDLEKEVKLAPYSFEDEESKKTKRGVTIYQENKKIADYYHVKEGEKWTDANGYPKLPAKSKNWSKEEWKIYFMQARVFLLEEVAKNKLYNAVKPAEATGVAYPKDEIKPEDIPF